MPVWYVVSDVDRSHHFRIQKYDEKPIFLAENAYLSRVESIKGIFNYLLVEVTIFTYLILRFVVIFSTNILLLVFGAFIFEHVNEHKTISITQQWRLSLSLSPMWKTNNKSLAPIPHTNRTFAVHGKLAIHETQQWRVVGFTFIPNVEKSRDEDRMHAPLTHRELMLMNVKNWF